MAVKQTRNVSVNCRQEPAHNAIWPKTFRKLKTVHWAGYFPQIDVKYSVHKNMNWKINTNRRYILNPANRSKKTHKWIETFPVHKNMNWKINTNRGYILDPANRRKRKRLQT